MSRWDGKSKGTVLGYQFFLLSLKVFGLNFVYLILRVVSYYYFLFARKNRKSITDFYVSALNFSAGKAKKITRKNFYIFGQTLVDRAAFLIGKDKQFTFSFKNENYLQEMQGQGKGGILLSAHLGNWETAGNLLKERITSKINVLMVNAEAENIKNLLESHTGGSNFNIIVINNDLSHIIKVKNALEKNEMIAMHADRYTETGKTIEADFLGRKAKFPFGPFLLASKFNVPVSFVFAIKEKKFRYALSATVPIINKLEPEQLAKKYIEELENKVKEHPEQWFNYYNFYE
ncbi:MAG: lysophospholipid acyltransferase family protein [Bacteroidia bacterium]|nr:lysophospholipid acyltransferase family protein [Bacteroidia bacterium]